MNKIISNAEVLSRSEMKMVMAGSDPVFEDGGGCFKCSDENKCEPIGPGENGKTICISSDSSGCDLSGNPCAWV